MGPALLGYWRSHTDLSIGDPYRRPGLWALLSLLLGKVAPLEEGKPALWWNLPVHVFFSHECSLFLFVPEFIFMDNLLREEIWLRWVGMTGLYLMATANNLLTAKRVSYLTVMMSSKGDISGCVIIAVKSIFSASKKNEKTMGWWRCPPDRLVLITPPRLNFYLPLMIDIWGWGGVDGKDTGFPAFKVGDSGPCNCDGLMPWENKLGKLVLCDWS